MRYYKKLMIIIIVVSILLIFLWCENNVIQISNYELEFDNLPEEFNNFKIIHLSDLHCKEFGKDNYKLIKKVKKSKPDIIVITGDLVDSIRYDEEITKSFIDNVVLIAPVYFVTGNHECGLSEYKELEKYMEHAGINVLRNEKVELKIGQSKINLIGIDDENYFIYSNNNYSFKQILRKLGRGKESEQYKKTTLNLIDSIASEEFTILLSHRPEYFEVYNKEKYNLIFSGHAHGGQIRIPFIGGLISPNQGMFPKYTCGIYEEENSVMVVSRGLGNSRFRQRIFNKPHIVVVKLISK